MRLSTLLLLYLKNKQAKMKTCCLQETQNFMLENSSCESQMLLVYVSSVKFYMQPHNFLLAQRSFQVNFKINSSTTPLIKKN